MTSRGVNKVILIGNIGQDPEVKYMPSGGAVTNISVATSESWNDKNTGQPQQRTEWHRVIFFNRLAEIAGEYLRKGSKVYIEGSLRTRKWQDKDGSDRYSTEIVASEMQMLDSLPAGGNEPNGGMHNNANAPAPQTQHQPDNMQSNAYTQASGRSTQRYQQHQAPQQQQQYQQRQPQNQGFAQNGGHNQQQQNHDNFDDDIPFAPIGLQFGKRSVLSM